MAQVWLRLADNYEDARGFADQKQPRKPGS
jgi:hypothetical protein